VWDVKKQRAVARERKIAADERALANVVAYKAEKIQPQVVMRNNIFSTDSDTGSKQGKTQRPRDSNPLYTHGEEGYDHDPFADHREYRTRAQLKVENNQIFASGGAAAAVAVAAPAPNGYRRGGAGSVTSSSRHSVDTMSLLHSPRSSLNAPDTALRSRHDVAPAPVNARPGARARPVSSGLSKEQLMQFDYQNLRKQQAQQAPVYRKQREPSEASGGVGGALGHGISDMNKIGASDIMETVRQKIITRGGSSGIRSLQRLLAIMDDNGDQRLSKDEFKFGLRDYGIDLSVTQLDQLFAYFDRDGNGFIDVSEFLVGIRGEMNARRKACIRMAFNVLDSDRSGYVTVEEIADIYDVSQNPEVISGKRTTKEALIEFMSQWEDGEKDGVVTYEEFENYYKDISASIDEDDYFELMIRNAWRIAGGSGNAANTANLRVLVTDKDGKQRVATVEKELGLKAGDRDEIRKRLMAQSVDAANIELYGGMDATEKPRAQRGAPQPRAKAAAPAPRSSAAPRSAEGVRPPRPPEAAAVNASAAKYDRAAARAKVGLPPAPAAKGVVGAAAADSKVTEEEGFVQMQKVLYSPPCTVEELGNKLMVSAVSFTPRISNGAFISRIQTLITNLSKQKATDLWKLIDPGNIGSMTLTDLHKMFADRFGKDRKSAGEGQGIIQRVIARIMQRCGEMAGIRGLQRTLMIMDDSGDKKLSKDELRYGLRDYGIEMNIRETDEIFAYFDRNRDGTISITEFLVGVRGDLNARRKALIRMAFDVLDTDGSGYVTVEEIADVYDVSKNPEVMSGKQTTREALLEFMGQWEDGEKDGVVSYEEFENYYKEISASIDGDDYFELMIRNAWRIAGGSGNAANTANLRVLVTDKDGKQRVATVEKELGLKAGDRDEIRKRLMAQGVDAANIELYGGMDATEKPRAQRGAPQPRTNNIAQPRQLESKNGVNVGNPRSAYDRNVAALKLATAFRGRVGRKVALQQKRKVDAENKKKAEEAAEAAIPRAQKLIRPFPKKKSN